MKWARARWSWIHSLDPVTTLLACKELGIDGVGVDVALLAVFVSRVKIADYDLEKLRRTSEMAPRPAIQEAGPSHASADLLSNSS
ncbi:MAG: hypothetical protein L2C94_002720 [Aigarchaeota archaeon]|nr:hypothetical protein [Candidatus Wolframiiraptor gerlachensis]